MTIKSRFFVTCLIFSFINPNVFSQELKKMKSNPLPGITEEYYVLKDNPDIRQGPYKLKINKVLYQAGFYKNNQRSGNWEIFGSRNNLDFKYNFDTQKLTCLNKRLFLNPNDSTSHSPLYLGGDYYLTYKISQLTQTPPDLIQNIKTGIYRAIVTFYIDTIGIPSNFVIYKSTNISQLDFEAIYYAKVASTTDFPYLPASSKGKYVFVPVVLPIDFIFK